MSMFDEQVFFLREGRRLIGLMSVHMDDLALTGTKLVLDATIKALKECFGKYAEAKLQRDSYKHLGYNYEKLQDGSYSTSLKDFLDGQTEVPLEGDLHEALKTGAKVGKLRGINGVLSYAAGARPDSLGCLSTLTSAVKTADGTDPPTWGTISEANKVLRRMKETNAECILKFPKVGPGHLPDPKEQCRWLKIMVISDSAFANLSDKRSQGAFVILLVEIFDENEDGQPGGRVHLIDWSLKRSTRITRSTFGAELLAAVAGLERGETLQKWLTELWRGVDTKDPYSLERDELIVPLETAVDAKDLFDACTNPELGKVTDKNSTIYLMSYREAIRQRRIRRMFWIPTESMLADDLTKKMQYGSGLWPLFYENQWWMPAPRDGLKKITSRWSIQGRLCDGG